MLIVDEDWGKVDPDALKAAGYAGAIGYVSEDTTGKNITTSQVAALRAAGLDVGLVSEYNPTEFLGGAAAGTHRGQVAVAGARALGWPVGCGIYAAGTDHDIEATSDLATAWLYASAYHAVLTSAGYRPGIYGGYTLMVWLAAHGWDGLRWQAAGWRGPNGAWAAGVNIRQTDAGILVGGVSVDRDDTQTPDWGQWRHEDMNPEDIKNLYILFYRVEAMINGRDATLTDPANPRPGEDLSKMWAKIATTRATGTLHVAGDLGIS